MNAIDPNVQKLGDDNSVWFKLSALGRGDSDNPMPYLLKLAERYGPAVNVTMGGERVLLVTEPDQFKHILVTKADDYAKYFEGLKPIFGKSMITHDGALWQKIRMPQQPAFHPDAFNDYIPFFNEAIRAKMAKWSDLARSGESFEMVEQTWTLAADMICKALFDRDMPFNPHVVFKYVKTYTNVQEHRGLRQRKQAGDSFDMSYEDAKKAVDAWWSVPPAVMAAPERDHRQKTLLRMIEQAVADPSVPEFDQQQAIDEIKQYLWAGTETTALTLSWALYLLSQNPEAAERVRKESLEVCGDGEPTAAQHSSLAFTRAVIQETMRLYPPVWSLIRIATKPDVVGGKEVKPGDRVILFTYAAHHNPKFWTQPEDFIPERWLDKTKKQVKYSYVPFGAGKRSCPGGAMSQVENTLALSMLLRRFRLEYVGPVPAGIAPTVTLVPKGGLHFKVHELS